MKPVRKIFVSYRRDDAAHPAGRIRDWFVQNWQIPREHVFMDVENILPGADFVREINRAIAQCDAMIIVISPSWLVDVNRPGVSYPRLEAEAGLNEARLKVIPVLVGGEPLPTEAQLPPSLHPLLKLNIRAVRADSFDYDLGFVARALGFRARRRSLIGAGLAVLMVAAGLAFLSQVPVGNPIYSIFHRVPAAPESQPTGSPTSPAAESPTTPPLASRGRLTMEQLKAALLQDADVEPDFSTGQAGVVASDRDCSRQEAAATVLGDTRTGISLSRPSDSSLTSRVILIREDLASYENEAQADRAMDLFGTWKDRCNTPTTVSGRPFEIESTIEVFDHDVDAQGDATSAAEIRTHILTIVGYGSTYEIVVVVRLSHTVCVLAFASATVPEVQGQPARPDEGAVSRYVAAAVDKLNTLT